MTNWFITGGFGFIGSSLANKLALRPGHMVRIFDNLAVGSKHSVNFDICERPCGITDYDWHEHSYIIGDVKNQKEVDAASIGADVIVHLAANTGVKPSILDPHFDCETNVVGSLNVLEACRKNKISRLIFASSGAPLGGQLPPLHEEMAAKPISPYGASKLAGEGYCQAYSCSFGLTTVILRFGNVYGPGSLGKESVVAKFFKRALAGLPVEIYGDGRQTRDYIYLYDLIDAIERASNTDLSGSNIFQIATSKETSLLELVEQIKITLKNHLGIDLKVNFTKPMVGDAIKNYADTTKAEKELGWKASTDLATGLASTLKDLAMKVK